MHFKKRVKLRREKIWKGVGHSKGDEEEKNLIQVELPTDVTDLIVATFVKRFAMRDVIRSCSLVSIRWFEISSFETPIQPPWLVVINRKRADPTEKIQEIAFWNVWGNEDSYDDSSLIYEPRIDPTAMRKALPSCGPTIVVASSLDGWLLLGCGCYELKCCRDLPFIGDHPLSLYNPYDNIYYDLAMFSPLKTKPVYGNTLYRVDAFLVFSIESLYPGDYFVVISTHSKLSLSRLDGEGKWFYHHNQRNFLYQDLLFRQQEQYLYAAEVTGVDIFAIESESHSDTSIIKVFRLNAISFVQVTFGMLDYWKLYDKYISVTTHLLEFCGDVILVSIAESKIKLHKKFEDVILPLVSKEKSKIELYKLCNNNEDKRVSVSQIHSIGEYAMFITSSGCGSYCVSAKNLWKVEQNCIYHHKRLIQSFDIISLEDGTNHSYSYIDTELPWDSLRIISKYDWADLYISPPPFRSYQVTKLKKFTLGEGLGSKTK